MSLHNIMSHYIPGWYWVDFSDALAPGDRKALKLFDEELVLWRDEEGEAHLMSAICPHMGAHLGHVGSVSGCELICQFHLWHFDTSGKYLGCDFPGTKPLNVAIKSYVIQEESSLIWMWYPRGEPEWNLFKLLPEDENHLSLASRRRRFKSDTNWMNVITNGVDMNHAVSVHGLATPQTIEGIKGGRQQEPHVFHAEAWLDNYYIRHTFYGPGIMLGHDVFGTDELLYIGASTPITKEETSTIVVVTARKNVEDNNVMAELMTDSALGLIPQDYPIWNHMQVPDKPIYQEGEQVMYQFHRWLEESIIN